MTLSSVGKAFLSNAFLVIGLVILMCFAILEVRGLHSDPLLPAFSALFFGFTAIIDRLQPRVLD